MKRRLIPSWQVVLSDLALILFLTTLSGLAQKDRGEAGAEAGESIRSGEVAIYRPGAGGLSLRHWLEGQPRDDRLQVTVYARYAPAEFGPVSEDAANLAAEARRAGAAPRLVLEPAKRSEVTVALAYDAPGDASQSHSTRLRPVSLAR